MRVVVTGAAGFIGSNLVDALLGGRARRSSASTTSPPGRREFLADADDAAAVRARRAGPARRRRDLPDVVAGADAVVHLAANADVRFGWDAPRRDLEQNVIVTHNVLEAMRAGRRPAVPVLVDGLGLRRGDGRSRRRRTARSRVQTSLYGASKLAAEAYIQAYAEGAGLSTTVFRFVSNLGPRYTHGHVIDFVRKLRHDPNAADDPRRRHPAQELPRRRRLRRRDGLAARPQDHRHEVFNLGVDDYCTVAESVGGSASGSGCDPSSTTPAATGAGSATTRSSTSTRRRSARPAGRRRSAIREAVERTVDYLVANAWLLDDAGCAAMSRDRRGRHRLRADRQPAGRGARGAAACRSSRCTTSIRPRRRALADALGGRPIGLPRRRTAFDADGVELVVVATTHAALAPLAGDGCRAPAATCWSRSRAAAHARRRRAAGRGRRASGASSSASASTTASTRRSGGPRSSSTSGRYGPLLHVRARYGHGGRLGYEPEWRAERELVGRRRAARPGQPPHRPHPPPRRRRRAGVQPSCAPTFWAMDVEDNAFLALRTAGGGFAWLHASWTEWKNLFSFEITLRDGQDRGHRARRLATVPSG